MNTPATQYQEENAIYMISGYFVPRPNEAPEDAFARAKHEVLTHLEKTMRTVRSITFNQWKHKTGHR